jgi:hypothetical protein
MGLPEHHHGAYRRAAMIKTCLCALALLLAGCATTVSGHPSHRSPAPPRTTGGAVGSTPDFPGTSATSTAAPTECVNGADFCDTFADSSSGWPAVNPSHYYADYDSFDGGTYRMGERTNAAISQDAPYDITGAANDYSVQVDVDALPGQGFGPTNELGFVCWEHPVAGRAGVTSAFLLELSESKATIGLWDATDGSYHEITSAVATGALSTTGWTHLTGLCLQGTSAGSAQAQLSLSVAGTPVVSANYDKDVSTYEWGVGEKVGLLAIGEGSDVYYDNFAITGKCAGVSC